MICRTWFGVSTGAALNSHKYSQLSPENKKVMTMDRQSILLKLNQVVKRTESTVILPTKTPFFPIKKLKFYVELNSPASKRYTLLYRSKKIYA